MDCRLRGNDATGRLGSYRLLKLAMRYVVCMYCMRCTRLLCSHRHVQAWAWAWGCREALLLLQASARLRSSIMRQTQGVKMSCMASSILPPGTTMVLERLM